MRRATFSALIVISACARGPESSATTATTTPPATTSSPTIAPSETEEGLPGPIDVCIEEGGALTAARVTSGRAGVYDPALPIVPEHLNWYGPAFCVSYPGHAVRRAHCGDRASDAPVVMRVLCQQ